MKGATFVGGVIVYVALLEWKTRRALAMYNEYMTWYGKTVENLTTLQRDPRHVKEDLEFIEEQLDSISQWNASWNPLYELMNETPTAHLFFRSYVNKN